MPVSFDASIGFDAPGVAFDAASSGGPTQDLLVRFGAARLKWVFGRANPKWLFGPSIA